ncbi:hypothetical protein L1987_74101 [Smallanthus sonchifolius]|uniref:Uncharacterized protein n=1 Tax=Smallanthus sonchifolius TaxID=185202 RepID=A0ACB9A2R0_9ASTR|nr:hypothetical protein L1987_74101 [Smallanthus sonchifolius]
MVKSTAFFRRSHHPPPFTTLSPRFLGLQSFTTWPPRCPHAPPERLALEVEGSRCRKSLHCLLVIGLGRWIRNEDNEKADLTLAALDGGDDDGGDQRLWWGAKII